MSDEQETTPEIRAFREYMEKAEANLLSMDESHLIRLRRDVSRLKKALKGEASKLEDLTARINEILCSRQAKVDGIVVTDHAVVRYLERVAGVDTEAVREKLRNDAKSATPLIGDRLITNDDYITAMVERSRIITVLNKPQNHTQEK